MTSDDGIAHHVGDMRTTLAIDDDVLALVRDYAAERSVPLGRAASDLIRRGLAAPRPVRREQGLVVAALPPDSPRVTSRRVRALQ
jgi:hypothetical protein